MRSSEAGDTSILYHCQLSLNSLTSAGLSLALRYEQRESWLGSPLFGYLTSSHVLIFNFICVAVCVWGECPQSPDPLEQELQALLNSFDLCAGEPIQVL